MAKRKVSVSEIASIIESEGLGYAIEGYISSDQIADSDLADMWERAAAVLAEITDYVEENADSVDDEGDEDDSPEENEY